jgi:hypothetical protein
MLCDDIQLVEVELGYTLLGMYSIALVYSKNAIQVDEAIFMGLLDGLNEGFLVMYRVSLDSNDVSIPQYTSPFRNTACGHAKHHVG